MTKAILSFIFLLLYPFLLNSNPVYQEECSSADNFKTSNEISDKFNFSFFDFDLRTTEIPLYRRNTKGSLDTNQGDWEAPQIMLVEDFNNDGIDDLMIEYNETWVAPVILYGSSEKKFNTLKLQDLDIDAARKTIRKAISTDFNNDGYMDIYGFTTGHHYQEMGINEKDLLLINQNGTSFKTIEVNESRKDAGNHGGFAIDINNDGWIDIVSLDEKENEATFPIKNINGSKFELQKKHISNDIKKYWIEDGDSADLNDDGFQDMVISVEESSEVHPTRRNKIGTFRIIYGDGDFDFSNNKEKKLGTSWIDKDTSQSATEVFGDNIISGTSNINIFDINDDKKPDILISEFIDNNEYGWRTSGFKAYINKDDCFADETNLYFPNQDTNRKFENESFTHFIGNFFHKDLNNDGFKDLILRVWWDEYGYFENSSTESFPFIFMNHNNEKYLPIPFSNGNNFKLLHSLSAGDFNGDGVMDIIGIDPTNDSKVYTYYFNNF